MMRTHSGMVSRARLSSTFSGWVRLQVLHFSRNRSQAPPEGSEGEEPVITKPILGAKCQGHSTLAPSECGDS